LYDCWAEEEPYRYYIHLKPGFRDKAYVSCISFFKRISDEITPYLADFDARVDLGFHRDLVASQTNVNAHSLGQTDEHL
jgi:hypothetical protein